MEETGVPWENYRLTPSHWQLSQLFEPLRLGFEPRHWGRETAHDQWQRLRPLGYDGMPLVSGYTARMMAISPNNGIAREPNEPAQARTYMYKRTHARTHIHVITHARTHAHTCNNARTYARTYM